MESVSMSEQGATEPLNPEREEGIRWQAYALWQKQGQPEGKDREHWLQAERERDGHDDRVLVPAAPATAEHAASEQEAFETSTLAA